MLNEKHVEYGFDRTHASCFYILLMAMAWAWFWNKYLLHGTCVCDDICVWYMAVSTQDGVNWLGFLNKYQLHGILCDDMGLGKTLQSLCLLATDHQLQDKLYEVGVTEH